VEHWPGWPVYDETDEIVPPCARRRLAPGRRGNGDDSSRCATCFDTPAELAGYAKSYGQDPAHWSFATGATEDIRKLGVNFGLTFVREGATFNHNVRTVVVDAAGRVQKVFAGNEWQSTELFE
jgi:hypothetical protein